MRYTISPVLGRILLLGLIKAMFAPAEVPDRFDQLFPKALMLGRLQLRLQLKMQP